MIPNQHHEHVVEPVEQSTRFNIERLLLLIWQRRLVFLASMIASVTLVLLYAFLATPVYRVSTSLLPRQRQQGGGLMQSLLGSVSGPAQLLGLNAGLPADAQEAIALLKSRVIFNELVSQDHLLPNLFAQKWNSTTNRWRRNSRVPTNQDAWRLFNKKIRVVNRNKETGVVTLQISWRNRFQAAAWANELVKLVNDTMRERALTVASASLSSLRVQYDGANSIELRNAIAHLMEVQISRKAMAKAQPDYAFTVIDPAQVPDADKFASPRRKLILLFTLPFGIIIGVICVLAADAWSDLIASLKQASQSTERKFL